MFSIETLILLAILLIYIPFDNLILRYKMGMYLLLVSLTSKHSNYYVLPTIFIYVESSSGSKIERVLEWSYAIPYYFYF